MGGTEANRDQCRLKIKSLGDLEEHVPQSIRFPRVTAGETEAPDDFVHKVDVNLTLLLR